VDPKEYLGKFWVDSLVHENINLEYLLNVVGEDKITLGSDYPFPLGEEIPGTIVKKHKCDDEVKKKILFDNSLNWLGINRERFYSQLGLE
jgi:aminocarboxymuconate-semialdehyde decarboxylase